MVSQGLQALIIDMYAGSVQIGTNSNNLNHVSASGKWIQINYTAGHRAPDMFMRILNNPYRNDNDILPRDRTPSSNQR